MPTQPVQDRDSKAFRFGKHLGSVGLGNLTSPVVIQHVALVPACLEVLHCVIEVTAQEFAKRLEGDPVMPSTVSSVTRRGQDHRTECQSRLVGLLKARIIRDTTNSGVLEITVDHAKEIAEFGRTWMMLPYAVFFR